jgi:hypothetical protein
MGALLIAVRQVIGAGFTDYLPILKVCVRILTALPYNFKLRYTISQCGMKTITSLRGSGGKSGRRLGVNAICGRSGIGGAR